MTRLILSLSVLEYRQAMAELIHEISHEPTITGVDPEIKRKHVFPVRKEMPAFCMTGLLKPPRIEALDLSCLFLADGHLDGVVQISTSCEYAIVNVYVVLEDDHGNQMESGFAIREDVWEDYWGYMPSASLPSGASVTVRAIVMDALGGVGIQNEKITI